MAVRALFGPINTPVPATQWFPSLVETLPTLAGKTIAVTGCTSGTGFVLARTAVELGAARVVLLNRASPRADSALEKLKAMPDVTTNVIHVDCDLSSFASVREAAAAVREAVGELDVLCLNAGVMGLLDAATPDGFDVQMYDFTLDPPPTPADNLSSRYANGRRPLTPPDTMPGNPTTCRSSC